MSQTQHLYHYELEIIEGLENFAKQEIKTNDTNAVIGIQKRGILQFDSTRPPSQWLDLQSVIAVYMRLTFSIPRPKALLGHQNFHQVIDMLKDILKIHPKDSFHSLYIDAAGSDSSVMQRLKTEYAGAIKLLPADEKADMHLRIRPSLNKQGWDVLARISPRPLATRDWRIANFEGALNGSVAHIMSVILDPAPSDTILNIGCGSGSLLIERALLGTPRHLIGIDNDTYALECARQNIITSGHSPDIQLIEADGRQLPFTSGTFNRLFADFPFGQRVGSHDENIMLYPLLLDEAARVATDDAKFAVITHEKRLMQRILSKPDIAWRIEREYPINLSGLHPQIYLLHKRT